MQGANLEILCFSWCVLEATNNALLEVKHTAKASAMVAMLRPLHRKGFMVSVSAPPSSVELHTAEILYHGAWCSPDVIQHR